MKNKLREFESLANLPDEDFFELEILNGRHTILFKIGGYLSILIVLILFITVYIVFLDYAII